MDYAKSDHAIVQKSNSKHEPNSPSNNFPRQNNLFRKPLSYVLGSINFTSHDIIGKPGQSCTLTESHLKVLHDMSHGEPPPNLSGRGNEFYHMPCVLICQPASQLSVKLVLKQNKIFSRGCCPSSGGTRSSSLWNKYAA
jgi:hypothetical protein